MPGNRRVLVTDSAELLAPAVDHLTAAGVDVEVLPPDVSSTDAVLAARGIDVLIVGVLDLADEQLSGLADGGTKAVVRAGIGYDNVDAVAARRHGIDVANVPDYCVDEVADHAVMLLLAASRRLIALRDLGRETWQVTDRLPPVHRIRGQALGLVGLGRIGQAVARRAVAFGYQVCAHDPAARDEVFAELGVRRVSLDDLLTSSDAVSLHCPLTDDTHHLIDTPRLTRMKPSAVLVNTSRGALVDLDALDAALGRGGLGAVALDVLDGEPDAPLGHPLLRRPEVLVTPHVAWYSLDARRELAIRSADEALRWLDTGAFRHTVND